MLAASARTRPMRSPSQPNTIPPAAAPIKKQAVTFAIHGPTCASLPFANMLRNAGRGTTGESPIWNRSNSAVTGYAINLGVSSANLTQAMMEAERVALCTFPGNRDGHHLEEVNIKETDLNAVCEQFKIEQRGAGPEPVYRSNLIYFDD